MSKTDDSTDVSGLRPLVYSPTEAAKALGISRAHFYKLLTSGEVRSVLIGRRRLIRHDALMEFLDGLPDDLPGSDRR